jgi:hypothetical protein
VTVYINDNGVDTKCGETLPLDEASGLIKKIGYSFDCNGATGSHVKIYDPSGTELLEVKAYRTYYQHWKANIQNGPKRVSSVKI